MSRRRKKRPKPRPRARTMARRHAWAKTVVRMKRLARETTDPRERAAALCWLESLAPDAEDEAEAPNEA